MAEPRFLEFLLKLSDMLRVGEPKLSAVRAMVAAALLREVDAGDGPSDSADSADDAPGVPEEGVTGVSGARKGASGKGVTGVSGAQARARGEDQDRDGPPLSTEELFRQIGDAINNRGLKFYKLHDALVKAADKHGRTRLVTDRLLLGYESMEYEEQMAVQAWWRKEDRGLPPSEREGRLRSRSSPRSGARDRSQTAAATSSRSSGARHRRSRGGVSEVHHEVREVREVAGPPSTITIYSMPQDHMVRFRNKVEASLELKAFTLLQSAATKPLGYHDGTHPQILAAAATCPGIVLMVRELRDWLVHAEVWVPGVGGVPGRPQAVGTKLWGIQVVCRHGRHRSVAAAELLGWLLRRKGLRTEIVHTALRPLKGGVKLHDHDLQDCGECGHRPTEDDLDHVERHWRD